MNTGASEWDAMAAWLDDKHGDEGDLWHRALIDPSVLRLLGPVDGLRILDMGCGNGYLARKLARLGAPMGIGGTRGISSARAYHRPLSWYVRVLREAGLVLITLDEPQPTQEFLAGSPQCSWIAQIPLHIVIEARKIGT